MNEQLVVKNFGPIKDATVDFKRVTVFIGPTGGGKSTLAKLAAIMKQNEIVKQEKIDLDDLLSTYSIKNFETERMRIDWTNSNSLGFSVNYRSKDNEEKAHTKAVNELNSMVDIAYDSHKVKIESLIDEGIKEALEELSIDIQQVPINLLDRVKERAKRAASIALLKHIVFPTKPTYIPSERVFLPAIEYSWAGLMRDDIGLSKLLLEFANSFSLSRKEISELDIQFLNVKYLHIDGRDFIKIPEREEPLMLLEAASGIQSVTPLLVLLEHLSRNTEQAQSFIIEEPELNLFPTAQFELVKILVEKCARLDGQNDLVLTTHSPYVLTALNLMCYAFRIAQQDEATAKKVARLIPRHCWIDPDQFAAYYVDRPDTKRKQQVRSIINKKTGLIEENELDTASDELADVFDKLVKLRKPSKTVASAK
ncbi:AAA family ATPase [Hymenobacter antarcticus]|uniref:DUF3696 domain-containing protein n=1 Tax=Hymenobacter antarcticus TaxID=486270 RepID=A0ABP7NYF1_9BACT